MNILGLNAFHGDAARMPSHRMISSFLLISLLFGQFLLLSNLPASSQLTGDEHYYVSKASYLNKYGEFPKADAAHREVVEGKRFGWSDFRPPGYPLFLALNYGETTLLELRNRITIIQFLLAAGALILLHFLICLILKDSKLAYVSGIVFGIQPWTFEYLKSFYPDSLTMSLATIGILGLLLFIVAINNRLSAIILIISIAILSSTLLIRPEMIVLIPLLYPLAIYFRVQKIKSMFPMILRASIVFIIFIGLNGLYYTYFEGKPTIMGNYRHIAPGLLNWSSTWFGTEHQRNNVVWEGYKGTYNFNNLPAVAFSNSWEQQRIEYAFKMLEEKKNYDKDIDLLFQAVANRRIEDNWFKNVLLVRVYTSISLWVNLETNGQLLKLLEDVPAYIRKLILICFFTLKSIIIFFGLLTPFTIYKRYRVQAIQWYDYLTILMFVFISTRTILIGFGFAALEHRYVLMAWPAMLWCAAYSTIILFRKNINDPQILQFHNA